MKKLLLILLCLPMIGFAQSVPQGINYQAVARDVSGAVLMNQVLAIQFSVISDITTGNVSWQETHTATTNDYGLFTAIIGQGVSTSVGSSAAFNVIDWGASNHLLKVEVDFGNGLVDMGTTAFMSVPYALYAANSGSSIAGPQGIQGIQGPSGVDGVDGIDGVGVAQVLSISGDTLFISSGNSIVIPGLSFINSLIIQGCTDSTMFNYNSSANTDNGSCIAIALGCTDSLALNYDSLANTDNGSCIAIVLGCTDSFAFNYDSLANTDNGSCASQIGDFMNGGIIFWLDGNGGGLIAATTDLWGTWAGASWIAYSTDTAIGTGAQNTMNVAQSTVGGGTEVIFMIYNQYNFNTQGYGDWFLPSKDELNEMYLNIGQGNALGLGNIGGFTNNNYWSSSYFDDVINLAADVWVQDFGNGSQSINSSGTYNYARPVRAF